MELELVQYNFDKAHLDGKKNVVADCLSRREYDNDQEQHSQNRNTQGLPSYDQNTQHVSEILDPVQTHETDVKQVQTQKQETSHSSFMCYSQARTPAKR